MSLTNDFPVNYYPPQSAKIRFRLWAFTKKVCCKCLISMSRGIFTDKAYLDLQALAKRSNLGEGGNKVTCIKAKQHKLYALNLSKVKTVKS